MKKIYKILPVVFILIVFAGLLYGLKLPPFSPKEPSPPNISEQKKTGIALKTLPPQTKEFPEKSSYKIYSESMKKGGDLAKKRYYALAINEYNKASSSLPGSIEPLNEIGKIYLLQRNPKKAIQTFEEVISMGARDDETKINLGRAYMQNGDTEKAKQILETISQQNQTASYYKGIIAAYSENYENSKNLFLEALNGQNEWVKRQSKIFLDAFNEFSKFEGGQKTHLKTLLAKALNQVEEYSLAIPLLKDVIKNKKDYRDAWIMLGYAYLNSSQSSDAVTALEEARKLDPSKPETLFFLGLAYFAENKIDNAINYIESGIEKGFEPRIQAYQKLAELYFIKQDYKKSVEAYESVLGINSGNIDYFIRPVWIYIEKLGNPSAALYLAQTSLVKHPNSAMAYNLIGWAYIASGNYDLAKKNLETAIKMDSSVPAPYLNLGQMYEKMGYLLTAKNYYKQAFELDKNTSSIGAAAAERYNKIAKLEEQRAREEAKKIQPGKVYQVNTFGQ